MLKTPRYKYYIRIIESWKTNSTLYSNKKTNALLRLPTLSPADGTPIVMKVAWIRQDQLIYHFPIVARLPSSQLVAICVCICLFSDGFLLEFQDSIVGELEHKSNYLKLNKTVICPQIKKDAAWKFISPQLWRKICSKSKQKFGILTLCQMK